MRFAFKRGERHILNHLTNAHLVSIDVANRQCLMSHLHPLSIILHFTEAPEPKANELASIAPGIRIGAVIDIEHLLNSGKGPGRLGKGSSDSRVDSIFIMI